MEISYATITLAYGLIFLTISLQPANVTPDTLAFIVVVVFAMSGTLGGLDVLQLLRTIFQSFKISQLHQTIAKGFKMPRFLRTMVEGSVVYFLLIFTSHFVLEMSLLFLRVSVLIVDSRRSADNPLSQIYNSCRQCKRWI